MSTYEFSADYVSYVERFWQQYLAEFYGRADVHMLEVGSYEGRSAIWFLENLLTHPGSSITCIDKAYKAVFDRNIQCTGFADKVIKMTGQSQELLVTLSPQQYDIIYIDGSHWAANVWADALGCWPLVKTGGVIIFDDYRWQIHRPPEERPKQAIDRFLAEFQTQIEVLHKGYQVIVRKLYDHMRG
ncbi:hypothetical protein BH10CHL1_BH10CHL1_41610 [soil metagenome]